MNKYLRNIRSGKGIFVTGMLCLMLVMAGCGTTATTTSDKPIVKTKVLIGGSLASSGSYAAYGASFSKSIQMAVDDLNAASSKYEFSTEILDDQATVPGLTANLDRLAAKTKFVVGVLASAQAQPAAQYAVQNKMLIMAPAQTDALAFTIAPQNMFSGVTTGDVQGKLLAEYVMKKGYKKIAILAPKTSYGKDALTNFTDKVKSAGGNVVYAEEVVVGQTDIRPQASKIKELGADVFVTFNLSDMSSAIVKALGDSGYKTDIVGGTSIHATQYVQLGGKAVEGTFALNEAPPNGWQRATDFNTAFEKKFNEKPLSLSNNGTFYDAVMMLGKAIEQEGPDSIEKVAKALSSMKYDGVCGPGLRFDGNRMVKSTSVDKLVNGNWEAAN